MSEIKDPVTSYREIAREWKQYWCSDIAVSWEIWWVLTLTYSLLTAVSLHVGSDEGAVASGIGAVCCLCVTNHFWGDYRGS